jgi:acylphosphatase
MPCNKIHIVGSVYKTGFRYYLKAKADLSGVTGVVFYEDDNSVGVIASGSEEKINTFVEFCKTGYPLVEITKTEVSEVPYQEFYSFEVIDEKPETPGSLKLHKS